MVTVLAASENFLFPDATFLVELLLFVVILLVLNRWVVPPLTRAMRERQDMVRKQVEDSQEAVRQVQLAEQRYESALAEARGEAASIRDEARADAQRYRDELREQADREVERIRSHGAEQLATQREQTVRALRTEIGGLATQLAERITGESLAGDGRRRSTVDRFLADLDQREPTRTGGAS